jgi:hypothetical protein
MTRRLSDRYDDGDAIPETNLAPPPAPVLFIVPTVEEVKAYIRKYITEQMEGGFMKYKSGE